MQNKSKILQILNLEKGETKIIILPIIYSFFLGTSLAFFVTSSTSLFLNSFSRDMLPLSFILAGVIVWLTGKMYSFLQKKVSFSKTLTSGLSFLLISIILFLVLYSATKSLIIIFLLYAWIRIFAYLHAVTFWGLAGKLFNLQQAKRIFGLITGGEVFAGIISFFSVPFLLKIMATEDLFYISTVSLIAGFITLNIITIKNKNTFKEQAENTEKQKAKTKSQNIDNKETKRYYKLFFIVAFIPIFAQFFVDFIFQAQAKIEFPEKESLTAFVGIFFGFSSIVEFILKTFVSGKLMSKYGIKLGLLMFPLVLAISFALASIFGLIYGAVSLFFSFVTMGRLFTRAVRTAFNDPATQILYQPLPPEERLAFQNKIESGPKAFAGIAAGILLFIFAKISWFSLVYFAIFLLVVILLWIKNVLDIHIEYKKILQNVLSSKKTENIKEIDRIFNTVIKKINISENKNKIIRLFFNIFPYAFDEKFKNRLNINKFGDFDNGIKFDTVISYVYSENSEKRLIGANLISNYKIYKIEKSMMKLLNDDNTNVRREAIISVGKIKEQELYPFLITNFIFSEYQSVTLSAMIKIGKPIVPNLIEMFDKFEYEQDLQIKIIEVLEKIGGEKSLEFLKSKLDYPNKNIKNKVILALQSLKYEATKKEKSIIFERLTSEIENFTYITASIIDLGDNSEIINVLIEEKEEKIKKIFAILSLLYNPSAIEIIQENFNSSNKSNQGFAIEIADNTISEIHKDIILPIIKDLSDAELISEFTYKFPQNKLSKKERYIDIINSDLATCGTVTKATAIKMLKFYNTEDVFHILKANVIHPSKIVSEISAFVFYENDKVLFNSEIQKLKSKIHNLDATLNKISLLKRQDNLLLLEKINLINSLEIFSKIPKQYLYELAEKSSEKIIKENETFEIKEFEDNKLYIIISGLLKKQENNKYIEFGNVLNSITDSGIYIAEEITFVLEANIYLLNNLLSESITFSKKIIENV